MAGSVPEGARPFLEELGRRAKEALQPLIEDATRRVTAEMMLKDAETVAALAAQTQEALFTTFWNHPTNMAARVAPGTDVGPVMSAMATAAVNVFLDYLKTVPVAPLNNAPTNEAPTNEAPTRNGEAGTNDKPTQNGEPTQ